MIWITGDYHGGFDGAKVESGAFPSGWCATREDALLIAGDFGLPWDGSNREKEEMAFVAGAPWTTLFIDGNHECFPYFEDVPAQPWHGGLAQHVWQDARLRCPGTRASTEEPPAVWRLMRGQVYELEGARVFTMGGATSIDKAMRTPGATWFPEELPSRAELAEAERNLDACGWEVDYVVTHCCATHLQPRAIYPQHGWDRPVRDALNEWFERLEDRLTYKRWYFGHYHADRDVDDKHTLLYNAIVPLGESLESAESKGLLEGLPE